MEMVFENGVKKYKPRLIMTRVRYLKSQNTHHGLKSYNMVKQLFNKLPLLLNAKSAVEVQWKNNITKDFTFTKEIVLIH